MAPSSRDGLGVVSRQSAVTNKVTFKPVTTSALRFQVVLQPGASAGLQEVRVK